MRSANIKTISLCVKYDSRLKSQALYIGSDKRCYLIFGYKYKLLVVYHVSPFKASNTLLQVFTSPSSFQM